MSNSGVVESNQPLFRALSPHAPLLWDCHCGSRTSCVAPIVCFVCERLSFGAMSRILLILAVIWRQRRFFRAETYVLKTTTFWDVYGEILGSYSNFREAAFVQQNNQNMVRCEHIL